MIPYINDQLELWAAWCRGGRARLGYPRQTAFVRAGEAPGGQAITLPDSRGLELEHAVQTLDAGLREVVTLFYLRMRSCPGEQIAQALGCSRDTVYARLHRAHLGVMEALNDQALQAYETAVPAPVKKSA